MVNYNGEWYVAASTVSSSGAYGMEFLSFSNWSQAASAVPVYADQTAIGGGYKDGTATVLVAPQKLWYVIYQMGSNIGYSTNPNVANPSGVERHPDLLLRHAVHHLAEHRLGFWVDSWVICDSANCYLFSMDDNGHLYRSQTSLSSFPNGMSQPVIAASNSTPSNFFEANNVYKVAGQNEYLLIVEAINSAGHRVFHLLHLERHQRLLDPAG